MPILQLILRDPDFVFDPRSDSSFNEAKKLYLRQEILRCFSWRLRAESDGVLDMASRPLNYAYKLGRELLASNFWLAATTSRTLPSFGQANGGVRAFVTRAVQGQVQMPISLDVEVTVRIRECLARVRQYKQALSAGVNGEKPQFYVGSDYSNGSKISRRVCVCACVVHMSVMCLYTDNPLQLSAGLTSAWAVRSLT